jgi:hypothetical protein
MLKKVHSHYLQPASITHCQLMTDDGSENFGVVQDFLSEAEAQHSITSLHSGMWSFPTP